VEKEEKEEELEENNSFLSAIKVQANKMVHKR
jgi:hypothetical protein